tara:strand:+ start:218 stop:865 length:648 start_codon:yes stop_codon:yes gene_type:complete
MNNEIEAIHKSVKTFSNARKFVFDENQEIVKQCRESINASLAANASLPGSESDQLKKSKEKAFKAAYLLKKVQNRLKTDYGKSWRQDMNEFLFHSEQEVVEAFALMNILNERGTTRELSFKIKDSTYETKKSTVKVSDRAYIFGLLDCIGELKRIILDLQNRHDSDSANKIFEQMHGLFTKLEVFTEYSNSISNLKPKIDSARHIVNDTSKLIQK